MKWKLKFNLNISLHKSHPRCTDSAIKHKEKLTIVLSFFGALFISFILLGIYVKYFKRSKRESGNISDLCASLRGDIFSVWNFDGGVVYEDIIGATENFNEKYCIGIGGNATVYKALLGPESIILAIKKIHSEDGDISLDSEAFHNEIISQIRHRNIVKLFGYCSSPQNKFLVYEYHERKDLQNILNNEVQVAELDWPKRRAIVKDIACALSYMHNGCSPPIVHRDVTSKNILLDCEFKASVSDFGIAKFLKSESPNWSTLAGTYGYIAPGICIFDFSLIGGL